MTKKSPGNTHEKFEIPKALLEDFRRCCKFYGTSRSAMLRLAVEEFVALWKHRHPGHDGHGHKRG